jgi:hypothetical protein
MVANLGSLLTGRRREKYVGRLHADRDVVEIVLLSAIGVVQVVCAHARGPTGASSKRTDPEYTSQSELPACQAGGPRSTATL